MIPILMVEDDKNLNHVTCSYSESSGSEATGYLNAEETYEGIRRRRYELTIPDIMMPGTDGSEFAKSVRGVNETAPILFMSVRDDLPSKQGGFQLRIDDYMVKPIELDELLLRVRALLRRVNIEMGKRITVGSLELNVDTMAVFINGEEMPITTRGLHILYKLLSYPGKTFSGAQLMDGFWGVDMDNSPWAVDMYITKLWDKFSQCSRFEIRTIRGIEYKAVLRRIRQRKTEVIG